MPRGDGSGPMGFGPMTGRGTGYCAGFSVPGYMNPGWGWVRRGRGFGRGRGWRHMYYATGVPGWARYPGPGVPVYHRGPAGYAGPGAPAPYRWDVEDEVAFLQHQAEILQEELADIEERLEELSKEKKDEKEDD
ncbi:MAG: DUF5320 domain-containing protein [Firmicutes bacterium]|nr:DUF5320 domain-containing protein [Bacillota bacterium]